MTTIRIRYVDRFVDRHGHLRHYFRRPGGPRIPLPGLPGSDEFISAYRAALDGEPSSRYGPGTPTAVGTFNRLALEYFASPDFLRLGPRTRYAYRLVIERFLSEHGHRRVAEMRREDVKKIMAFKAATPGSANDLLKKIRTLIKFAIEARWPLGSRERTAFALHLYTGQRRADVARMAWTDVAGNAIHVVQQKTGARLMIPLHPNLSAALRAWPRKHVIILTTAFNRPFSYAGYGT
jgi:integrase